MKTTIVLAEKDIKRAIEEYLVHTGQGQAKSIRFEQGNHRVTVDFRDYSDLYAEIELEVETDSIEAIG